MLTTLILSMVTATGLFLMTLSLRRVPGSHQLRRIQALREESRPDEAGGSLLGTLRSRGLDAALRQADLAITPTQFLHTALLLGLSAFLAGLLISRGLPVAVFAAAVSVVLYLAWLTWRRDSRRLAYEEAIADLCDRLAAGALLTGTLQGAMTHAADSAPEILQDDVAYIASQLSQSGQVHSAFADVLERRRSTALGLLADTLSVWSLRGATLPLQELLTPLSSTIRALAGEGKRMHSELSGTRLTMVIVSLAPAGFVLLMRLNTPALARLYASPTGQWIQLAAYTIAGTGYLLGQRILQRVQAVLTLGKE